MIQILFIHSTGFDSTDDKDVFVGTREDADELLSDGDKPSR